MKSVAPKVTATASRTTNTRISMIAFEIRVPSGNPISFQPLTYLAVPMDTV